MVSRLPADPDQLRDVRRQHLLTLDPDLGALLSEAHLEAARRAITVPVAEIGVGEWDVTRLRAIRPAALGLLIVDGVLASETLLDRQVATELVGAGDLLRPWLIDEPSGDGAPTRLNALSRVRMAILDQPASAALIRYPQVQAMLMERLHARVRRLATLHAIVQQTRVDDRLRALFQQLAERWGRVGREGVIIPLVLSHRQLGELIGARRPTVSTALAQLAEQHEITRRDDGTWLLHTALDAAANGAPTPEAIRQRRHFTPAIQPARDAPDDRNSELEQTLNRLRELTLANRTRLEELREQATAIKRRAQTLRTAHEVRRAA